MGVKLSPQKNCLGNSVVGRKLHLGSVLGLSISKPHTNVPGGPVSGPTPQAREGPAFLSQLPCTPISPSLAPMKKQRWVRLLCPSGMSSDQA